MKNKVIKAGIGYTIGNYLIKGLVFFSIPIFARILSVEEYGLYNTFISYESVLSIFISCAIHTSYKNARYKFKYISEGAKKNHDFDNYVSNTLLFIWINTIFWLLLSFIISRLCSEILKLNFINIMLLVLYSGGSAIILCYNSEASINYKYKKFLKVSLFNSITNIGLSIILIYTIFDKQRYFGRVFGTVVPVVILAIYITVLQFKRAKPKNHLLFFKWGLKYSLPIVPHGISQVILSQFDRIMINTMVGSTAAGVYSFAYNIYTIIMVTVQSLDSVWNTWFYEQMQNNRLNFIKKISNIYILGMLLFCSIILFISPELIKVLGSEKYRDAIYCVIPIVVSGFFSFLYNLPASIEYYYEKTKYIAFGTMCAAIINILLNFVFINKYGYVAAAYTTLFTYILYFLFHYLLARNIIGFSLYSNKCVVFCSISILIFGIICQILVNKIFIRYLFVILIIIIALLLLEYSFSITKRLKLIKKERYK